MELKNLIPWGRNKDVVRRHGDNENMMPSLQRDINQVFKDFWERFDRPLATLDNFFGIGMPSMDVTESNSAIEVAVELPGMDEKDIEISVDDDMLIIRGEKRAEKEEKKKGYYLAERSYGSFHRTVPLPSGVDRDKIEANFKKGVLTVTLPKTDEARQRMRKIEVKAA